MDDMIVALEKLRDEWANYARVTEIIIGDNNPAALTFRFCIGSLYNATDTVAKSIRDKEWMEELKKET